MRPGAQALRKWSIRIAPVQVFDSILRLRADIGNDDEPFAFFATLLKVCLGLSVVMMTLI